MAEMFVRYSKTKEEFISSGLESQYGDQHIVFIEGDVNGNGSCIFARGTYYADLAGYVKGVSVNGSLYNASGGYIGINSKDSSKLIVSAESNGIEIGLSNDFLNTIDNKADLENGKIPESQLPESALKQSVFVGTQEEYTVAYTKGKIDVGTLVIILTEAEAGNDTISILGTAILGKMILGKI